MINDDSYGTPINNNQEEDSYGTPIGTPLNNALQTQDNANPFLNNNFNNNEDSYGSPIPNKYVSPPAPAPEINNNAFSAPTSYSGPVGEYTPILTPVENTRSQDSGTVQATIRVVNAPNKLVGNGPFVPSDTHAPSLPSESQRNTPQKIDTVCT